MKTPIFTGSWGKGTCHIQGIAIDPEKGFIYCSFTTKLIKYTLDGQVVGSVDGLMGHLGCIAFNKEDGRIYGSLEYKNDAIGRNILGSLGSNAQLEDAFYMAIFDVDKITRMDMDAERDGIMTSVYLSEVVQDYNGTGVNRQGETVPHRYGCSGIDGTAYGPVFGQSPDSEKKIMICYGVYSDVNRGDNDHQVILQYDPAMIDACGKPLTQKAPHHSGCSCEARYFFYTGNTTYGVQNLEYDPHTRSYLVAVYTGKKESFTNYPLFFIDATKAPRVGELIGRGGEQGRLLTAAQPTPSVDENGGCWFGLGQTGVYAFGDGRYAFSKHLTRTEENGVRTFASEVVLCRLNPDDDLVFTEI